MCVYTCACVTWLAKTLVLSSHTGCPASVCVHLVSSVDTTCVAQCLFFPMRPTLQRRIALSASFCMSSVKPPHASFVVLWPSDIITDAGHSDDVLAYTSATMASARAATATNASPPAARPRRATPSSGIKVPSAQTRTPTSVRLPPARCPSAARLGVPPSGLMLAGRSARRLAQTVLAGSGTAQRLQAAARRSVCRRLHRSAAWGSLLPYSHGMRLLAERNSFCECKIQKDGDGDGPGCKEMVLAVKRWSWL